MIPAIALALVIVAAIVAVIELIKTRWQSLMAWGLLVLCISLLVDRM